MSEHSSQLNILYSRLLGAAVFKLFTKRINVIITDPDLYYLYIRATHRTIDCDSLNLLSAAILCLQQAVTQLTMLPVTVDAICFCLLCSLLCSELEDYVDHLQRSSITGTSQLSVTLRDIEEGAMSLRGVGETLAILKG